MAKRTGGTAGTGTGASTRRQSMGGASGRGSTGAGQAGGGTGQRRQGGQGGRQAGQGRRRAEEEGLMGTAREFGEGTVEVARAAASRAAGFAADAYEQGEESGRRVVAWVRDNPWPSLLIGAGAAWLAIDAVRGGSDGETEMERRRRELDEEGPGALRRSVSSVADFGRRSASTVADASRGAGEQVTGFVRENPMWAGLAALGIGLAVGLALPSTMPENRMLGNARDSVVRKARQVADSATETVREVAKSAGRIAGTSQRG